MALRGRRASHADAVLESLSAPLAALRRLGRSETSSLAPAEAAVGAPTARLARLDKQCSDHASPEHAAKSVLRELSRRASRLR
jgi:hypothetical protein